MQKQKLLIIDDSVDIHELVEVWLAEEPVEFSSCFTGEDGLAKAASWQPELILLDVDLPAMNGFEVCQQLKGNPATKDIPVVFLTGASSTEEKLRGLELGATDYVIKPFDPAELRARVRSALNTKSLMNLLEQKAIILQESEERFRVLAENSSDVISRHSPDGVYRYVSPACFGILGYTSDQLQGCSVLDFAHPDDVASLHECLSNDSSAGETCTIAWRFRRSDGPYLWLESTWRKLLDPVTGALREIHASARDITARKQMETREQVRAEVLEMIAEGIPLNDILRRLIHAVEKEDPQTIAAGVMLSEGTLHHCAPNLPAAISASIERQLYAFVTHFDALGTADKERVIFCDLLTDPMWLDLQPMVREHGLASAWSILIRSRHRNTAGAFTLYRKDRTRPNTSAIELAKLASELTAVAVEHRQLTDQLTFQAHHDALTQLPNRAMFNDQLKQILAAAARQSRSTGVLLIDIDRFKYVNDTYGHQAGDELLCQVAHRLSNRLRMSDILSRLGGDEFAVILTTLNQPNDIELVARSLVEEFGKPLNLRGREFFVTISIGAALAPDQGVDLTTLLKNADVALYRSKEDGRNTSRCFTPEMGEGTTERLELEGALRHAVQNNELQLHYQPKVDPTGRVVGLEALVRWNHPQLGLIPPAKFIPLAEDTGLILPIGAWVLAEAARQTAKWTASGIAPVPIAVNVSTLQFTQADFVATIASTVASAGVTHEWLEIELTESLLMRNMRDAAEKLARLKELHVRVAIDDFGTGYSSLAYLQRLSLDTLKIDQSFVSTLENGRHMTNGRIITTAIISLAKSLGLSVIAEGVETPGQRDFLLSAGCDLMQGYLFSPPKPAAMIESRLVRMEDACHSVLSRNRVA